MQLWHLFASAAALLRGTDRLGQPIRCAISVCKPFESDCSNDGECVTDKCYESKCGLGATCSAYGEICFTDSPHTCCTGECQGVVVRQDCIKLLGGHAAAEGVNIDRQCDRVGVCQHWPGVDTGPGVLTTPWAVDAMDTIGKYYALAGLTFKDGTRVDVAHVIARQMGRVRAGVSPSATKPRSITDAGIIHFVPGARVATEIVAFHEWGDEKFCISPVLLSGEGGGYYAVGIDCCTSEEFNCGEGLGNMANHSAVVVNSNLPEFAQARAILEANAGSSYHGDGKGLETDAPLYVWWTSSPEGEQNNPTGNLQYVPPPNGPTFCVAPIGASRGFFAVGENCCDDETFSCGPVDDPAAKSGALVSDLTGDYIQALKQADFKYGWKTDNRPIFLNWTAEVLVTAP